MMMSDSDEVSFCALRPRFWSYRGRLAFTTHSVNFTDFSHFPTAFQYFAPSANRIILF